MNTPLLTYAFRLVLRVATSRKHRACMVHTARCMSWGDSAHSGPINLFLHEASTGNKKSIPAPKATDEPAPLRVPFGSSLKRSGCQVRYGGKVLSSGGVLSYDLLFLIDSDILVEHQWRGNVRARQQDPQINRLHLGNPSLLPPTMQVAHLLNILRRIPISIFTA